MTRPSAAAPSAGERLIGLVRLTHPFPSLLDGLATVAFALVAGGSPANAGRLGMAMVALQASIGILNDVIDAPHDAGHKPGKPIPAGLVSPVVARTGVAVAAAVGVLLALPSGLAVTALALVILAIGYVYDRFAKGTAWSWLPFAVGIPLLPVFGWLGANGTLPAAFAILLPTALVAGAALAIANARADLDRDAASGVTSVATRLGAERAWTVQATLFGLVAGVALGSMVATRPAASALAGVVLGVLVVSGGTWLGRDCDAARRERAWEAQAVGIAVLAASWLAGMMGEGGLG
jgi:4-hydroxybenzoate polyprenyltransferase